MSTIQILFSILIFRQSRSMNLIFQQSQLSRFLFETFFRKFNDLFVFDQFNINNQFVFNQFAFSNCLSIVRQFIFRIKREVNVVREFRT